MTNNPFSLPFGSGRILVSKGYHVFPVEPGKKYPASFRYGQWEPMEKWRETYSARRPSEEELYRWGNEYPFDTGIGLLLGECSGLVGLDFDYDIDNLHKRIEDFIVESPVKKCGAKGYTAFYQYSGEKSRSWQKDGREVLALMSDNRQTVLPPTRHPDGMNYAWWTDSLTDVKREDIPYLPVDFEEKMDKLFEKKQSHHIAPSDPFDSMFGLTSLVKAESALKCIDPDCGYQEWLEIGMGLKSYFGDAAYGLWDEWSSNGHKYKAREMQRKWDSFKGDGCTIATVFHYAQLNGFQNLPEIHSEPDRHEAFHRAMRERVVNQAAIVTNTLTNAGQNITAIAENNTVTSAWDAEYEPGSKKYLFNEAPNSVGRISRWMTQTAIFPDSILSIACSIAFMGVVMAHKVQTDSGLRSNIYTMGIAPSGTGKDHARKCAGMLLAASEQKHLLAGQPASTSGLFSSVLRNNGRALILMDEFGRVLQGMTSKNAANHAVGIPTLMMELFSSADGEFLGTEYGNRDGKNERTDIQQPCLSVYATTTPEPFYAALTSNQAVDGFLSRWLLFETKEFLVDPRKGSFNKEVPELILQDLLRWKDRSTNCAPKGNIDAVEVIKPKIVRFTATAEKMADAFLVDMRKMAKRHLDKGTGMHAVFNRTAEHAIKLALVGHEGDLITEEVYDWACQMAFDRSQFLAVAVRENIADSQHEKTLKRMLRLIASNEGITSRDLTRKCQDIKKRDREEILVTLIESEQITCDKIESGGNRPVSIYRAVSQKRI
jgi:hypothetical protein